jgi:hypothetical protein
LGTVVSDPGAAPWTFTGPATLVVSDILVDGDQFAIFDNSVLVGDTSVPVNDGSNCGNDPAGCTGSDWSHGTFEFGAGSHSITMTVIAEATGATAGNGVFALSTTPEPASFTLIGFGCLGLLAGRKFIRRRQVQ